jgi:hypothetical protein
MSEALAPKLSAEALAFVQAGAPRPASETPAVVKPAEERAVAPKVPEVPEVPVPKPARAKTPKAEAAPGAAGGLVSMSVRVPPEIPEGLIRASADRKIKKQKPWTQQEIIAEALSEWLQKHGGLP